MSVIELGLVTDDGNPPPEPARRPLRRGDVRRVLVAAVAALCGLTVTGSAPPESHGPRQLWSVPFREGGDVFTVADGTVYVLTASGNSTLRAYGLRTGAVRWSSTGLGDASWVGSIESGVMLLPAADATVQFQDEKGGEGFRQFTRETVAIDAATGRRLWRRPGEFSVTAAGRVLLIEWNADGSAARTLHVLDLRDGTPVWSRPAGGVETWVARGTLTGDTDRLLTVTPAGRVSVYDLTDGHLVSTGRVPWKGENPGDDSYTNVSVEGHVFYLESVDRGQGTLTAYDTETLRAKWHTDARSYGGFYPCGAVLCVNDVEGTTGYDRETGEVRWRTPGSTNGIPLGDGRLVVADDANGSRHSLIDGATGRRVADLGHSSLVWDLASPGDPPYLVNHSRTPAGLMYVAQLDRHSGEIFVRGTIEPVLDYSCQSAGNVLVCITPRGRLTVTDAG
ncbi:PQQ-binding-like beta-propeller repeat protein [Actinoplanes sp. NPDC049681]|uniref:outer membrane protein assembly factor BamB family protein n=1 Tax=Actinoplanes sp. NPDC049681 TaxID=3363905 RepID=UPI0037A54871